MKKMIAVYIHWPYCLKKCPYCDFNSHVSNNVNHDDWRKAYQREIEHYKNFIGDRQVTSIFFGGGTPSLMEPQTVDHVINTLHSCWDIADDCEITIEANPTSIEAKKFKLFHAFGVNRVSIGVQSLRDEQLKFLGREHNAQEAMKALDIANHTFDRMSFDLIYARPEQTLKDWQEELSQALKFQKGHMSLYQLTIEDGTQFKTLRDSGRLIELDYDCAGDMYAMTSEMMAEAGLPAYEISNYAASNQQSRHNLTYWRYQDYVGIGPGAHGRLTLDDGQKIATRTHKAPDVWMRQVFECGSGAKPFEYLSVQDCLEEKLMMGLRLREGIDYADLSIIQDKNFEMMIENKFLVIDENRLKVPVDKWPVLDSILAKLLLSVKTA